LSYSIILLTKNFYFVIAQLWLNLTSNNFTSKSTVAKQLYTTTAVGGQRGAVIVSWAFVGPNEQKFVVSE